MCGPHQVWPLRSECCGRGIPTKVVCAECVVLVGRIWWLKGFKSQPFKIAVGPVYWPAAGKELTCLRTGLAGEESCQA